MQSEIDAASVTWFHDRQLRERDWPVMSPARLPQSPGRPGTWEWIAANHRYNGLLWREQERTRRLDVPPSDIAAGKRLIDRYDQKRNDAVDAIDVALLASLHRVVHARDARLSSETAGAMIDRLSMLALGIHHMRAQTQRGHVDEEYARACAGKLARLNARRRDLLSCLDTLLLEARAGRAYFKIYRQVNMYDEPALHPCPDDRVREQSATYDATGYDATGEKAAL